MTSRTLVKLGTRSAPLLLFEAVERGQTEVLAQDVGKGFSTAIRYYDGRSTGSFRIQDELESLKKPLLTYIQINGIENAVAKFHTRLTAFKKQLETNAPLTKLMDTFGRAYALMVVFALITDYWEQEIPATQRGAFQQASEEIRSASDKAVTAFNTYLEKKIADGEITPFTRLEDLTLGHKQLPNIENGFIMAYGKIFQVPWEEFLKEHGLQYTEEETLDTASLTEFSGSPAFPGRSAGIVRLVFLSTDLPKVGEGDILVSPMTMPMFIPAMHRAAAFVTDEGGTLCHAAIIARELKKPCVVGTRFATKILKDGDRVEVDANQGIIRILKKSSIRIEVSQKVFSEVAWTPFLPIRR
ncbi:MAG: hypothetical protein RL141_504 [Candidatus Parcubacteria bacterium]